MLDHLQCCLELCSLLHTAPEARFSMMDDEIVDVGELISNSVVSNSKNTLEPLPLCLEWKVLFPPNSFPIHSDSRIKSEYRISLLPASAPWSPILCTRPLSSSGQ